MEEQENEITLKELIEIVRENWQYIMARRNALAIAGIIGALLGVSVALIKAPKYEANLTFVIDEENTAGGLAGLASSFGLGGALGDGQSLSSPTNVLQFLTTRSLVEKALLRPIPEKGYTNQTFADLYVKTNRLDKGWENDSALCKIHYDVNEDRTSFSRDKDSILLQIYEKIVEKKSELNVTQLDKKNSFIKISVISKSEVFAKNFPETLIDVVSEYYSNVKTEKAKIAVAILQHQTDSVKQILYSSMGGAASSLDQVFGLNPAMNVQKVASAKEQTQVQISIATLQELIKNLELAKVRLLNNTPVFNVVDKPIYPLEVLEIKVWVGLIGGMLLSIFAIIFFFLAQKYTQKLTANLQ